MKSCLKVSAFTLIELLVSISVLAMMAAISVSSYPKFSEQLGVTAESYKVLAYMREAQVYGSSGYTDPGVKVVYGLEIDRDTNIIKKVQWQNPNSTTNSSYINNKVDTGEVALNLGSKFEIEKMCNLVGTVSSCDNNGNYTQVYVFFKRPNPEARLLGKVGTILYPDQGGTSGLQKIEVHIRSKQNQQFVKKIVILQTGQMYVE
jgi:prepilin-type N-terminal cleavage/methylation domain-containing protein